MFKKIKWYAKVRADIKKVEANIKQMKAINNGQTIESVSNMIAAQERRVASMKKQVKEKFWNPHFTVA